MDIIKKIAAEFKVKTEQVENTVGLIDEGNTIPFIARYRKEVTGGLSDVILRDMDERLKYLRGLEERKEEVIRLIDEQGKLTPDLQEQIEKAEVLQRVEDLYKPNLSIFHQEICHLSLLDLKILLRFQYTAHRSAVDRLISLCTKRMYRRAFGLI